jgi:hypothetical protein|eukprot:COSAG01_NODE_2070_length_8500_cov_7.053803_6_plen_65_part_00
MKHLFAKYLAHNEERVFDDLKDLAAKIASACVVYLLAGFPRADVRRCLAPGPDRLRAGADTLLC